MGVGQEGFSNAPGDLYPYWQGGEQAMAAQSNRDLSALMNASTHSLESLQQALQQGQQISPTANSFSPAPPAATSKDDMSNFYPLPGARASAKQRGSRRTNLSRSQTEFMAQSIPSQENTAP